MSAALAPAHTTAAGLWHRYAAWSLDFAVLAPLAAALTWPRLHAGWQQASTGVGALMADLSQTMADTLMTGVPLPQLAHTLLQDPALLAAAAAVQSGILAMTVAWLLAYALLAALWHVGGECSRWQGSPGKRALQLRVVDLDGQPLRLPQAALRHVAGALSWLTLNLGHALAALPPQRRTLHDYIAGTRVIDVAADPRLPRWAAAWLWLQALAAIALPAWWLARRLAALRAGLG